MEKFEKSDERVVKLLEKAIAGCECDLKKMFGYPVAFVNGNMFSGTFAERLFFRIKKEEQATYLLKDSGVRPFVPVVGRPMKDYLEVVGDESAMPLIRELALRSYEYTRTLPLKIKAEKKKKTG
jgi:TfoX/Sxy family transcriptional regulator of competence genes